MVLLHGLNIDGKGGNVRRQGTSRNTQKRTQKRVFGTLSGENSNVAHPSPEERIENRVPLAFSAEDINMSDTHPGESFGIRMGDSLLYTFQVERGENSGVDDKWLETLKNRKQIDTASYFIDLSKPAVILNTQAYWNDKRDINACVFLSLNSIVDTKNMGKRDKTTILRTLMNGVLLGTLLTQCAPERDSAVEQDAREDAPYETQSRSMGGEYIVKRGDTLSMICREYGNIFSVEELKRANGLRSDTIRVGNALRIPSLPFMGGYTPDRGVTRAIPVSRTSHINQHSQSLGQWRNIVQIGDTTPESFMEAAMMYNNYSYKVGGTGSTPNAGIDSSQLIVNSLIGSGCLPEGTDTTVNGLKSMSQHIGNTEGKTGDFLIMGGKVPHIAIISANLGGGNYLTIDASPKQKRVCENTRRAGSSYAVYRNPFIRGNGGIQPHSDEVETSDTTVLADRKKIAEAGIQESYLKKVIAASEIITENQEKYEAVEKKTGVPWQVIAAIHFREASCDFSKGLHNGQRWDQKTTIVPVGKGPFESWEDAAVDAIKTHSTRCPVTEITLENDVLSKIAKWGETFNGLGYRKKKGGNPYTDSGLVSPEGIPFYSTGLYVKDGVYNAKKVDRRPGIMAILLHLLQGNSTPTYTVSPAFIAKAPEKQKIAEVGILNILTNIRGIPVTSRKAFLRQHGAEFGIPFADEYRGTVDQNKTLTMLMKSNTSFREKWTGFFTGQKSRDDTMAAN